jgi:hypothetical protein
MGDHPLYTCKTCRFSSQPYEAVDGFMIECRRNRPGTDGFPMMRIDCWCWDGFPDRTLEGELNEAFK